MFRANFEHKDTNLCVKPPPPSFFVNNSTGERLQAELTPTWLPCLTPEDTGQAPLSKYQKLDKLLQSIRKRSIRFNVWKLFMKMGRLPKPRVNQLQPISTNYKWLEGKAAKKKLFEYFILKIDFKWSAVAICVVRTSMHFKQLQHLRSLMKC